MRMQDHGHRGVQPTGYRTRDIEVTKGANVVRVPEPIYDEGSVIVPCAFCFEAGAMSVIEEQTQDALDGAALRRLREALPSHVVTVKADAMAYGSGWLVSAEDGPNSAMYALEATIIEAADKCREALHERKLTLAAWRTAHEQHQLDERWVSDCEACMYELMEGTRTL